MEVLVGFSLSFEGRIVLEFWERVDVDVVEP